MFDSTNSCEPLHELDLDDEVTTLHVSKKEYLLNKRKTDKKYDIEKMLLKQISNLIQRVNDLVDKSTNTKDMSTDTIDAEIKSFRLEYGLNTESVVFDSKPRMNHINHN